MCGRCMHVWYTSCTRRLTCRVTCRQDVSYMQDACMHEVYHTCRVTCRQDVSYMPTRCKTPAVLHAVKHLISTSDISFQCLTSHFNVLHLISTKRRYTHTHTHTYTYTYTHTRINTHTRTHTRRMIEITIEVYGCRLGGWTGKCKELLEDGWMYM